MIELTFSFISSVFAYFHIDDIIVLVAQIIKYIVAIFVNSKCQIELQHEAWCSHEASTCKLNGYRSAL